MGPPPPSPRRLHTGYHRRLDTAQVDPRAHPIARQIEIVETALRRFETVLRTAGDGDDIAVAWVDIGPPVLGLEARRPLPFPAVDQGRPVQSRRGRIDAAGPEVVDIAPQPVEDRAPGAGGRPTGKVAVVLRRGVPGLFRRAAEIGDMPRTTTRGPVLPGGQVGHIRPGAEGVGQTGGNAPRRPAAQLLQVGLQPQLQGLGSDRFDLLDHALPGRPGGHQLGADGRQGAQGDAQDDPVEIDPRPQDHFSRRLPGGPVRFELDGTGPQRRALGQLVVERGAGPTGDAADFDERAIGTVFGGGLAAHGDGGDSAPVGRQAQFCDLVEKLEDHPAPPQHFVEGGKDDLPHTRPHLVEDGAAVGEEQAQLNAQGRPGPHARPTTVAVHVRKEEIVGRPHQRRVHRQGRSPVAHQPLPEFKAVDGVEALVAHSVAPHAAHVDPEQIEDDPQTAPRIPAGDLAF